jgi:hypothetical protein
MNAATQFCCLAVLVNVLNALPTSAVQVTQATSAARIQQRQEQLNLLIPESFDFTRYPVNAANERHWRKLLWATAIAEPNTPYITDAITQLLSWSNRPKLMPAEQKTVHMAFQISTQLYLSYKDPKIEKQLLQTIEQSNDPEWVAIATSALVKGGIKPNLQLIQKRFPQWKKNVALYTTVRDLEKPAIPPLKDLLNWQIAPNQFQLYVLCPQDRNALCKTLLKDGKGQFVKENGTLWSIPLMARSLHNLSWNFSRGQTPQGVYRIEGTIPQPDTEFFRAYGFFALVQLFVPFESGVKEFVPNYKGTIRNLSIYQRLLPPSWRSYFPLQQTFWAGKAGRTEFRIHGSGDAPSYFASNQRLATQGWNPAIGCLSALELYDETGRLTQADMPKLLEKLRTVSGKSITGYLIVVETASAISQK